MLAGVVADRIEVYPAGAVQHLMAESGRMIANGVLSALGEHTARVELQDGKPWLHRPPADPVEILVDLPGAAAAAGTPMAEA